MNQNIKKIEAHTRLEYEFDLLWDIKYGYDLDMPCNDGRNNKDICQLLAHYGYDVKEWKKGPVLTFPWKPEGKFDYVPSNAIDCPPMSPDDAANRIKMAKRLERKKSNK